MFIILGNHRVERNCHSSEVLRGFHLNGHTQGFHPQTQKLDPPCTIQYTVPQESIAY